MARNKSRPRPLKKKVRASTEKLAVKIGIDVKAPTIPLLKHTEPIKEPASYRFPPRAPEISEFNSILMTGPDGVVIKTRVSESNDPGSLSEKIENRGRTLNASPPH